MKHARHSEPAQSKANICFNCKKACGGCPWTEIDSSTNRPKFTPVPGWTATKTKLNMARGVIIDSYHITECPLFDKDDEREVVISGELSVNDIQVLLKFWKDRGE